MRDQEKGGESFETWGSSHKSLRRGARGVAGVVGAPGP